MWPRGNAKGAMAALLTGYVLGMWRLVLELNRGALDGVLAAFAGINFLHFAVLLFTICTLVLLVVSIATAPPPAAKVDGLTFATAAVREARAPSHTTDVVLSIGVALLVVAEWWYFSG